MKQIIFASGLLAMGVSCSVNADSLLRVKCFDDNQDAEVFINNKFVGNCPLDAPVPDGIVQVRARKKLENDYERLFEKQLTVVDGIAQKIEIVLSSPQLTAEGQRKKAAAEVRAQLDAAAAGDVAAMQKVAARYETGDGVEKSPQKASFWRGKAEIAAAEGDLRAAQQGNIDAMLSIASRYESGRGVEESPSQAQAWREKADAAKRAKAAQEEQVRQEKMARERARLNQQKIDNISFFPMTNLALHPANQGNPIATTLGTVMLPTMLIGDLISAPFRTTEIHALRNEAALRPSVWGKPDSMLARASRQRETEGSAEKSQLVVARN